MFLAEVIGTVVAPVQIPLLDGETLLLLRPVDAGGKRVGKTRIGIDRTQAGVGDRVLVMDEGNSARQMLGNPDAAAKTVVVGVVDYIDRDGELVYDAGAAEAGR
jgi:microcompartment protein CcmK/EutM